MQRKSTSNIIMPRTVALSHITRWLEHPIGGSYGSGGLTKPIRASTMVRVFVPSTHHPLVALTHLPATTVLQKQHLLRESVCEHSDCMPQQPKSIQVQYLCNRLSSANHDLTFSLPYRIRLTLRR